MKKVLIVHYSQSGQLSRVAEHFTQPLVDAPDIDVRFEALVPLANHFHFHGRFSRAYRPWKYVESVRRKASFHVSTALDRTRNPGARTRFSSGSLGCRVAISAPAICTVPAGHGNNPHKTDSSVVLPAPFGPSKPKRLPFVICRSTPDSAGLLAREYDNAS